MNTVLVFALSKIHSYKKYLIRSIIVGTIISIIVTALSILGHFRLYENIITDYFQSVSYKKAQDVVLLFITDNDYKRVFGGISPLSRRKLADIIKVLVKLKARVIALDIDITEQKSDNKYLADAFQQAVNSGIPIVIIGNLIPLEKSNRQTENLNDCLPYADENTSYTDERFLLFKKVDMGISWQDKLMYGGAMFRMDRDSVFRKAELLYMVESGDKTEKDLAHPVPSFPVTAAAAYSGMDKDALMNSLLTYHKGEIHLKGTYKEIGNIKFEKGGLITPVYIGNYRHFNYSCNLKQLLDDYGYDKPGVLTIFKDKVVIVGGTYDIQDFYITPLGKMSGMEILANITQSILNQQLISHTNFYIALFMEILFSVLISFVFIITTRLKATMLCLITLVPITVAASMVAFYSIYYWLNFIPTIAGVVIHGWFKNIGGHEK